MRARGGALLPGGVVGDGRYRLLAQFGVDQRGAAHLWRARDGQLRRDVALTILVGDSNDTEAAQAARKTLERAAHAARFSHIALCRVLDVLSLGNGIAPSEGVLGMVVTDWVQGTDLLDLIAEHPLPPMTAARLLEPLASAVELAHHQGLVLGVDHPQRIRVGPDGALRLAFPGPLPDASMRDDVKGLGAILYLLLTGRWALPGGPEALPRAPKGPDGVIASPRALVPHVPDELSSAAVRSIDDGSLGSIRTGGAMLQILEQVMAADDETQLLAPIADQDDEDDGAVWTTRKPVQDRDRRRKLAIGVTLLAVATVAILAWVGMQLISLFSDDTAATVGGPTVVTTTAQPSTQPSQPTSQAPAPQAAGPIKAASVGEFNITDDGDNPRRANRAVDDNDKTAWKTSTYKKQFPVLKPGIGLLASFAEPLRFAQVVIDSPSDGTVVEIRSAPSNKPNFDETKVIATATLNAGETTIDLPTADPTEHLVIWITKLHDGSKGFGSELTEVKFVRAG